MSRFFVSGYPSDSSSEEEDLLSSSEEELILSESEEDNFSTDSEFDNDSDEDSSDSDSDGRPTGPTYFLKKDFMKGGKNDSDSDSDDEGRKVVKSAKDKLLDDMKDSIESINTAKRAGNWTNILNEFEKLGRFLIKVGQQKIGTPNFYIKCLGNLEDYINETVANEKETTKKMNATYSRAFNTVRQRVKKQIKEYQAHMDLFRSQPELFDTEEPLEGLSNNIAGAAQQNGEEDANAFTSVGSKTFSPIFTVLKQISETRGKKNIDKFEQLQTLEDLLKENASTGSSFELISIYQMLLSIRFDASSNQSFMPIDQWKKSEADLNSFLDLLEAKSSEYQVSELGTATDDIDIEPIANAQGVKVIFGSIASLIERLDDELTRSLQYSDPHSIEYIERLKDESIIYKLIVRGQLYIESTTPEEIRSKHEAGQLFRIVMRRLEHIHYKPNQLITANETEAWKNIDTKFDSSIVARNSEPNDLLVGLSDFLTLNAKAIYGKNALLCSIYYYAINNQYTKARDLFLTSHIYSTIHNSESALQVMYNRALVQLGLSAFKAGVIEESHQALNEIANSQRLKELLGQGFNSKYPSQATAAEKQKLLPFHMHINLELLECVFMTSSLLIEIPAMAAASSLSKDSKRKASLKSFKSKLDFHDRQYFTGPPESIKDHVVHASIALQKGDWSKAYQLLSSIKIWKLFPDTEQLLSMMKNQLQVEGLRTYIFTYKSIYSKLSIAKLSTLFELENESVHSIVEKMIQSGDISASIDESKSIINFISNDHQRTKLQELAIVMNEKVGLLTEKNEKTASNGYSRKQPMQQQQQQQQQKEQKELQYEENNRFRYANVNTNNDEFQTTA